MTAADAGEIRPFSDWLLDQSKGRTHAELSQGLHDLIAAVTDVNKQGTLTLTIKVTPMGDGATVKVSDDVSIRTPKHARPESVFFVDHDGNLTRNDPDQLAFDGLREVQPVVQIRSAAE